MSGAAFQGPVHGSNILTGVSASGHAQQTFNFNNRAESKPFYVVPYERNESFVSRPDITSKLEKLLPMESNDFHSAALWGLGGSGKTQVALEYAYSQHRKHPCSIFWVHADNEATFTHDYGTIAQTLGLNHQEDGQSFLQDVRRKIESLERWLLVIDNADDLSLFGVASATGRRDRKFTEYIPKGPNGTILWTSRDEQIGGSLVGSRRTIQVSKMMPRESKALLETTSSRPTSEGEIDDMVSLLAELQHLPLAITQAGAYMRRTGASISEYLSYLREEKDRWRILKEPEFDRHRLRGSSNSILQTWSISIHRIEQESKMAYKILHILAYFDNQNIPDRLIEAAATYRAGKRTKEEVTQQKRIAVRRLKDFSFLTESRLDGSDQTFEMHKLVQDAARHDLQVRNTLHRLKKKVTESRRIRNWFRQRTKSSKKKKKRQRQDEAYFASAAIEIIDELFPNEIHVRREKLDVCERYLAHTIRACDWAGACSKEDVAVGILRRAMNYLMERCRFKEALPIAQHRLWMSQKVYGKKSLTSIRIYLSLGWIFTNLLEPQQSEAIANKALQLAQSLKEGDKDELVLECKCLLSKSYWGQGRRDETEKVSAKVLEQARANEYSYSAHFILSCIQNLATLYKDQGRFEEAANLIPQVSEFSQTIRDKDPWLMVDTDCLLANLYYHQGEIGKAEETSSKALQLSRDRYGEDHPKFIRSLFFLAIVRETQGRYEEAVQMMRDCCHLSHKALGADHQNTRIYKKRLKIWLDRGPPGDL
ncbi:hypothetical protein FSARC_5971 [Fusarium sarcochroum]|uniref:AAA+ ATPase domain-containing protein n=1 Tax=Fusarium sarcochroum TaxID=1208366 RepID=A0A8H4TY97_9HYPO|nr:hypothetical protein FSARC_5971 [Fusarium sarcochroum]